MIWTPQTESLRNPIADNRRRRECKYNDSPYCRSCGGLMRRRGGFAGYPCCCDPCPSGRETETYVRSRDVTCFLHEATCPVHVTDKILATWEPDISAGGTGSFGVWIVVDDANNVDLIDLNVRKDTYYGDAIDFDSATIHNPSNDTSQRWDTSGTSVGSVASGLISNMKGVSTSGSTGIDSSNSRNESSSFFDSVTGGYLFATVAYTITDAAATTQFFLQIGTDGIEDGGVLVTNVVLGLQDPSLDASDSNDIDVDSATEEAKTNP